MGVEEEPLPRLNVTDDFAREYVEHGGSPSTVGKVDPDATTPTTSKRTYYRGPETVVTNEFFIIRGEPERRVKISDLSGFSIVSDKNYNQFTSGLLAVELLIASLGALTLWFMVDSLRLTVGFTVLATVAIGASLFLPRRRRHRWQLHANYRGASIVLLSTTEEREFAQVRRALLRAIESMHNPH